MSSSMQLICCRLLSSSGVSPGRYDKYSIVSSLSSLVVTMYVPSWGCTRRGSRSSLASIASPT
eukprot:2511449-Amphidinium_carterae.1